MQLLSVRRVRDYVGHVSRHNFFSLKKIESIRRLDALPESELRSMAAERASNIIRLAGRKSSFYKLLYADFDLNVPFNHFYHNLPVIRKADIRGKEASIATMPTRFMKKAYTSGTSGTP